MINDNYDLEDLIEKLLDAKGTAVRRAIDAACCQTRSDWDRAHAAEEKLDEVKAATIKTLAEALQLNAE